MNVQLTAENKFPEGMVVTTKSEPSIKMIINTYMDRVYFCVRVGDRTGKELPCFERELQKVDPAYFLKN
jgi:hypothetical protein